MKTLTKYFLAVFAFSTLLSCTKSDDNPVANDVTLHFNNTFKDTPIVLGDATSTQATKNESAEGQIHHFAELKYVISNIRLIKSDGSEIPYNINDLDKGATVVNHAKPQTLDYILSNIPVGEYSQIKFGLGVKQELNTLDEVRFPNFYKEAGANDTKMMWEWGTGYRFTKLEGFYEEDHKEMSIHTGSTLDGERGQEETYVQGVDAYRDITLELPEPAIVGNSAPKITIRADFDKLLSGEDKIVLKSGRSNDSNATPNIHTADQMVRFVNNIGGNNKSNTTGMFSVEKVIN